MAKTYDKIPGLGSGRGGLQIAMRSRIYRSIDKFDHLLIVQSTGYTEEYKRIFYRDIRLVEVRKTRGQLWAALISGAFTLALALLHFTPMPAIAVILICSPFLLWFIINLASGPTVECYVSTNVQTLKLPTPRRRKKVAVLIDFLREQTAAAEPVGTTQPA